MGVDLAGSSLTEGFEAGLGSAVSRPLVALSGDSGSLRGEWLRQR